MGRRFAFKLIVISGLLATVSFLIMSYSGSFPQIINFNILAAITLIPLGLGIYELIINPLDKPLATKFCIYNLAGIFTAIILINCYFVSIIYF